jgi:hypothetical protein
MPSFKTVAAALPAALLTAAVLAQGTLAQGTGRWTAGTPMPSARGRDRPDVVGRRDV